MTDYHSTDIDPSYYITLTLFNSFSYKILLLNILLFTIIIRISIFPFI